MNVKAAALLISSAIFADKDSVEIDNITCAIEKTRATKVRFVKLGGFTFIEQNPFNITPWGKEIVEGRQVMWVMKDKDYVAIVSDGKFKDLR
jgi:hypothetical protein